MQSPKAPLTCQPTQDRRNATTFSDGSKAHACRLLGRGVSKYLRERLSPYKVDSVKIIGRKSQEKAAQMEFLESIQRKEPPE